MPVNPTPLFKVGDKVHVHNREGVFTISRVNPLGDPLIHQSHAYWYKDDEGCEFYAVRRGYYEEVFTKVEEEDDQHHEDPRGNR